MQRALEVESVENEPSEKHREEDGESHPVITSMPNPCHGLTPAGI